MRFCHSVRWPLRNQVIVLVISTAGALLVAVSGFAPWMNAFGIRLSGFRMAELMGSVGDRVQGAVPRWVGAAWYLLPIAAGVCWTLTFLRTPPSPTRAHIGVGAAVSAAVVLYMSVIGIHAGPSLAVAGGLMIMISGLLASVKPASERRASDRRPDSVSRVG